MSQILRRYGDRDSRLAVLVSNLGGVLYETGDYAEAEQKYRDALNIWNSSGLAQHQDAARCLDGLAATLRTRGAIPEAIDTSRQAVATFEAAVGAEHPATLKARMNFAMLELDYGDPMKRASCSRRSEWFSNSHPSLKTPTWPSATAI